MTGLAAAAERRGLGLRPMAALALIVVSLGLPWGVVGEQGSYVPPWLIPGGCWASADGTLVCDAGTLVGGYYTAGLGDVMTGYATSARVLLVPAAALLVWAAWRGRPPRLGWTAALLAGALALTGTALRLGAIASVLALVLILLERRSPATRIAGGRASDRTI